MTAPDARLLAELAARVQALEAWRTHQTDLLDELLNGIPVAEHDDPADEDEMPEEELDVDALIVWVHEAITSMIARPLRGELVWCHQWWDHSEAVFRFEALRRAWTELAPEPGTAMSIWIRDHLDPCCENSSLPRAPSPTAPTTPAPAHWTATPRCRPCPPGPLTEPCAYSSPAAGRSSPPCSSPCCSSPHCSAA